jgi:hypothetical protein
LSPRPPLSSPAARATRNIPLGRRLEVVTLRNTTCPNPRLPPPSHYQTQSTAPQLLTNASNRPHNAATMTLHTLVKVRETRTGAAMYVLTAALLIAAAGAYLFFWQKTPSTQTTAPQINTQPTQPAQLLEGCSWGSGSRRPWCRSGPNAITRSGRGLSPNTVEGLSFWSMNWPVSLLRLAQWASPWFHRQGWVPTSPASPEEFVSSVA